MAAPFWVARTADRAAGERLTAVGQQRAQEARNLADELAAQGHRVSANTVAGLLAEMGYSLQATSKQVEGAQHPDRDGQFRSVNQQATAHLAAGQPVISVDTKKKEVVGNLANKGREWQPKGDPVRAVPLTRHDWHGEWNYTIAGATARPTAA